MCIPLGIAMPGKTTRWQNNGFKKLTKLSECACAHISAVKNKAQYYTLKHLSSYKLKYWFTLLILLLLLIINFTLKNVKLYMKSTTTDKDNVRAEQ